MRMRNKQEEQQQNRKNVSTLLIDLQEFYESPKIQQPRQIEADAVFPSAMSQMLERGMAK